jgi:hypothetical protein
LGVVMWIAVKQLRRILEAQSNAAIALALRHF